MELKTDIKFPLTIPATVKDGAELSALAEFIQGYNEGRKRSGCDHRRYYNCYNKELKTEFCLCKDCLQVFWKGTIEEGPEKKKPGKGGGAAKDED